MTSHQDQAPAPNRRWALWLGRFLLIPLIAMSGGLVFALCRTVVTGEIVAFSRGWRNSSRFIYFAESPVLFLFFFTLAAAVTGVVIFSTVVLVRLVFKKTRSKR